MRVTCLLLVSRITSLGGLPEELVCAIFERVLARAKLNPRVLQVFVNTQHELLLDRIRALRVRDTPAIIQDTRNLWLGEKPGWY